MTIATLIGVGILIVYTMYSKNSLSEQIELLRREIMADLTALKEAVEEIDSTGDAVIEMLNGIAEKLEAASGNQAEVDAIAAQIRQQTADFADAVEKHTPAENGQDIPEHPEPADDVIIDDPGESPVDSLPEEETGNGEAVDDVLYGEETPEMMDELSEQHDVGTTIPADEVDSDSANNQG